MGRRLLRWSRSRYHLWALRAAGVGGALVVGVGLPGGTLLAATHPQHGDHSKAWEFALVVVLVLAVLGIGLVLLAGLCAFLTRPVAEPHAVTLRLTAETLEESLAFGTPANYGSSGHRPEQAFRAHFPKLGDRLNVWDETVSAPSQARNALDHFVDAVMAAHDMSGLELDVGYNVIEIKKYATALAMARANALVREQPHLEWSGYSTAGGHTPGPPEGKLKPNGSVADWISLQPLDGESADAWRDRADTYTQRVDAVVSSVYVDGLTWGLDVLDAEKRLEDFRREQLPTILDALKLVGEREAPRVRRRCESC